MRTLKKYPLLILFAVFLFLTTVTDMIVSRRAFSEMENRYLAQRPPFTFSQLFKNEYTPKYETYINDQFVGRDQWITLKSVSETALGKIENNGIVYGADNYMFEKYRTTDDRRAEMNTGFINRFVELYVDKTNITVAVIPNSYEILCDKLPQGLDNLDQGAYIADVYGKLSPDAAKLDLVSVMETAAQGAEKPVYYRTDHHWTTFGAYSSYKAFAESRGLKAVEWSALTPLEKQVPDFYGSYYSKAKLFSAIPDTITYFDIPFTSLNIDGQEKNSLYDSEKWQERDKHAAFLWGNNGVTVMKSDNNLNHEDGKTTRVMLVKDSYGNSFAPLLTYSYDEVYVIDLRSLTIKMNELMARTVFDDVLVMYNFMNYTSDTNVARLTY